MDVDRNATLNDVIFNLLLNTHRVKPLTLLAGFTVPAPGASEGYICASCVDLVECFDAFWRPVGNMGIDEIYFQILTGLTFPTIGALKRNTHPNIFNGVKSLDALGWSNSN